MSTPRSSIASASFSRALHRVAVNQRAESTRYFDHRGDGLDDAGLVVGEHDRDERGGLGLGEKRFQRLDLDEAVAIDGDPDRTVGRGQHRIVLDRRDKDAPAPGAEERERVGLGTAAREHDALGRSAGEGRDRFPRILDQAALGAAEAVNRRRVPGRRNRFGDGALGDGSHRRRRIVIEIEGLRHDRRRSGPNRPRRSARDGGDAIRRWFQARAVRTRPPG